jgi:hypothetical protein
VIFHDHAPRHVHCETQRDSADGRSVAGAIAVKRATINSLLTFTGREGNTGQLAIVPAKAGNKSSALPKFAFETPC